MKNIYTHLLDSLEAKKQVALATIIEAKGSTPQVPGASAIFSSEGLLDGTVGGGILEGDAQQRGLRALKEEKSLLYDFNLEADITSEEGAICGGKVKILIDASPEKSRKAFQEMKQSLIQRKPGLLTTLIGKSEEGIHSILRSWVRQEDDLSYLEYPLSAHRQDIERTFTSGKPALLALEEEASNYLFLEPFFPLPQLIIAGAGHIGRAVAHLGSLLDFEVTVIDDRPEFANKMNIPDADHIIVDKIEKAMESLLLEKDSYVVIVTRGHRHDAEALRPCVGSKTDYIGMIGSAKKISLMREKFLAQGWATLEQFDRVHAPIGIDIGSKTVEEIAVSIAAQLVEVRSQMKKKEGKMKIGAMILAAGESIRMGEPKLLLPFGKKTIIETVIDNIIQSKVDEVLVVLGSNSEKIEKKVKDFPVMNTVNPYFKKGMLSSVQWGFKEMSEKIQGVLVCLGDQPSISTAVIDKIIDAYRETGKGIVVPTYNKNRGHPVLIDIKYREEVQNLSEDVGLRGVVYNHPEDTLEVEVDSPAILRDIDNPADYHKELEEEE